jgi:hypothetical protein
MLALAAFVVVVSAITAWLTTTSEQHQTFALLAVYYAGSATGIALPGLVIGAIWGWLSYNWQRFIWPCITVTVMLAAIVWGSEVFSPDIRFVAAIMVVPLACALLGKGYVLSGPLSAGPRRCPDSSDHG